MNPKAQEFINKIKEEKKAKELIEKEEHLISLGLIDENRSGIRRVYSETFNYSDFPYYDSKKDLYYKDKETYLPIEVTDEEYQEILKYAPINKKTEVKKKLRTTWADAIEIIANLFLAINIIGGIVLCVTFASDYSIDDFAWIPIVLALTYCFFWYPLIRGFSKIVEVAEKSLQK